MSNGLNGTRGITLIEVLMVVAIMAIVLATGAPAFGNLVAHSRSDTAASTLAATIQTARSTAVERRLNVLLCPSTDGLQCTNTNQWHHGWLVFVDRNGNDRHDEDEDVVNRAAAQAPGVAIVSSAGRRFVRYRASGAASGTNLTLTACDRGGTSRATSLVINNAGRLRSAPAAAAAAAACVAVASAP